MKKLILTSPLFSGEVELLYGVDSKLVLIDMRNAELTEKQVKYMKDLTPIIFDKDTFKESFKSDSLTVVEENFEVTFDMWYKDYPYKRNRDRCDKLWSKMSKADRLRAYAGNKAYKRFLAKRPWQTTLDPENYLKNREWLNEYK